MLYAADHEWWRVYGNEAQRTFTGEMWSVSEGAHAEFGTYWIRHGKDAGFCKEPDTINGGGNSGYQAIHLAATFGASRILILGLDMMRTGGRLHWHGRHDGNLPNGCGFKGWIEALDVLYADLRKLGVEVINCSRQTAWKKAPRATIAEALP